MLIEALLAVVILSGALTLIIRSMITSMRASVYNTHYAQAIILVENVMFENMRKNKNQILGAEGNFSSELDKYRYQIATETFSPSPDQLNELNVELIWLAGKHEKSISLSTLLNTPAEKE